MSGGVDSSVAAALLKEQGYFVAGAYMKNFSEESWQGVLEADCPWEKDVADAKAVCDKLGIEFRSFNFEKEYAEKVIEYFFAEYAAGRTPNPDIMCNKEIKFGLFLEKALELGFDYIATGHYARVQVIGDRNQELESYKLSPISYHLTKGLDPKKDQSYFLYTLMQEQLKHVLFPIGEYTKPQVRQLARDFELPNAEKKDSQGLCFVGHINLREFLKQRLPERAGEIVDPNGNVIGSHPGAWYYTIGQRHGLGIGARPQSLRSSVGGQGGSPYYVSERDVETNVITVVEGRDNELMLSKEAKIRDVHWINGPQEFPLSCTAKIRYQQKDQRVTLTDADFTQTNADTVRVLFEQSQFAIAPGQAIVFYDGDRVLGGGIIV